MNSEPAALSNLRRRQIIRNTCGMQNCSYQTMLQCVLLAYVW